MTAEPLLVESAAKLRAALALLFASADDFVPYDPGRAYAPKEREPGGVHSSTIGGRPEAHDTVVIVGSDAASSPRAAAGSKSNG